MDRHSGPGHDQLRSEIWPKLIPQLISIRISTSIFEYSERDLGAWPPGLRAQFFKAAKSGSSRDGRQTAGSQVEQQNAYETHNGR